MDSMSSNLKATLPLNVDEDPELLNLFKGRLLHLVFFPYRILESVIANSSFPK